MSWGYSDPPKQKQSGLHLLEDIGCNRLQVDNEMHLNEQAMKKLAADIVPHVMIQLQLQEDILSKMVEQVADQILKKMVETPDDPTIEAIVEAIRSKKAARFDGID